MHSKSASHDVNEDHHRHGTGKNTADKAQDDPFVVRFRFVFVAHKNFSSYKHSSLL